MKLWIARDKNGDICLYKKKPQLDRIYWYDKSCGEDGCICFLNKAEYPEVTFENSPQKVRLELVKEEEV